MDTQATMSTSDKPASERGDLTMLMGIIAKHREKRGGLIAILQEIQSRYSYLPEHALRLVAESTGHPLVDVYGVATFYRAFSLKPRGKHLITVCLGTACHVRSGVVIARELERVLDIRAGDTTEDGLFTLETAACLGACALGPIVVVDGDYHAKVRKNDVFRIVDDVRQGMSEAPTEFDDRMFPLEVACPRCNHTLIDQRNELDGHPSIRVTVSFNRQHGSLRLSSLYGSYTIKSDHEIPWDTVVHFFCPHCHAELTSWADCTRCSAPMVSMLVRGGGTVQICSRRGCKEHRLDVGGMSA
ncbi:MAG: NAD(P)H-dependent oxidoreductase subunit E [Myxococcota bacterium]